MRCIACASPAYLKWHGMPRTPDVLREHECLSYAYASYGDNWRFFKDGEEFAVPVSGFFSSNCSDVIRQACLAGRGIAIMPIFLIADELRTGALVELFSDHRFCVYTASGSGHGTLRVNLQTKPSRPFSGVAQ